MSFWRHPLADTVISISAARVRLAMDRLDIVTQNDTFAPMSTTIIRARVDSKHAKNAREILSSIGLKTSDAVSMLMAQIVAHRGIPFAVQEDGYAYAMREYGATPEEVDTAYERMNHGIEKDRKAGKLRKFTSIADLRE